MSLGRFVSTWGSVEMWQTIAYESYEVAVSKTAKPSHPSTAVIKDVS